MKRLEIIRELRRHRKLAEKRAIDYERNKTAKYVLMFLGGFVIVYLIFFAVIFSLVANESTSETAIELMMGISPYILLVDFLFRFVAQQTPSQIVKPYVLLPIPKSTCIDTFVGTSLFTWGNAIWFAMLIPYAIMSVLFVEGFWPTVGFLLCFYLLILANSQWYSIVRTLINNSLVYWLVPIVVYAIVALPVLLKGGSEKGFENFFDLYAGIGTKISDGSALPYLGALALLVVLVAINRRLQMANVMREISKTEQTKLHSVSQFAYFDRFGEVGQYLKLEIKSILRNKNPRKGFVMATAIVLMFSLIIALTDVYDGQFMTNFWCVYNFVIYGSMQLTRVMCNEGNYIDCLMVRRENILKLLRAKYIFNTAILVLPFVLMLPTVFAGKWSILMLVAYAVFTAGFQYFILFQMAVYNKQTVPLNTKFISKSGMENNYYQVVVQMLAFFLPIVLISVLQLFLSDTVAYLIILLIGVVFVVTQPLWMRNIYNRMMQRKYVLMEGFRSSR
ncbi:MAG: hypothetical protein II509_01410 [Prevotella sp.]|nr:hypothetical protein [Prevotella sp.]